MNDGSRRVICSINGDRESCRLCSHNLCATWFEAMKARAVVPIEIYALVAEGFDI